MSTPPHPIPLLYRLTFNWFEPFTATAGALQAYFFPQSLQAIEMPRIPYNPLLQPFFTQRTGLWLLLAFHDAVTLRATNDITLWRLVLAAGLFSDYFYTLSIYEERGAARFWDLGAWDANDWITLGLTLPPMAIKLACVAGVGFAKGKRNGKGGKVKR